MPEIFKPRVNNVRAVVTTKWDKRGYKPVRVNNIEEYWFDTALDNDSDQWSITIGLPADDFTNDLLRRDNEVRAQIYGIGVATQAIAGGIADEVRYSDDQTLVISGRDFSSLATDSTAPPREFRSSLANRIVEQQAKEIRIPGPYNLHRGVVKKYQYTDGSESYWQFWHRLYRKDKMWIWCGPDGTLNAGKLNYSSDPAYFFGDPPKGTRASLREKYVPVTSLSFTKSTQQRLAEIWVYGHKGDNGFLVKETDPKTKGWIKRSRKIMLDTDSHRRKGALKLAWEEFHEGTMGELEVSVTIPDPGYLVRQNRIARINLPDLGISGEFFVVGARVMANEQGFVQEVRMREKNYAISRRVPSDPKITEAAPGKATSSSLGTALTIADGPQSWMPYFVKAAKEFHRPWDFELFLAALLGMCNVETSFRNIRSNGGPGGDGVQWYKWEGHTDLPDGRAGDLSTNRDKHNRTYEQWRTVFANEPGQYVNRTFAVGPMQLYSSGYKHWADDYMRAGYHDQWQGGRWHPEHNIRAAARALRGKLRETVGDTGKDEDLWAGVKAYNGAGPAAEKYKQDVKNKVYNDPGYLQTVKDAVASAREAATAQKSGSTDTATGSGRVGGELMSAQRALSVFRGGGLFGGNTLADKQEKVVAACSYAYHHRNEIDYVYGGSAGRGVDMAPPPNVPNNSDCSGFARWVLINAGIRDPGMATGSQITRGRSVSLSNLQIGDLVFYGRGTVPRHVTVYMGNGKVCSQGSDPGPLILNVNYDGTAFAARRYT